MVAAMDKVGVDGAIFISAFSMYRYDASYAVEVQRAHPGRLAIVKPVDPDDPAVADVIADWKKTPGTVGIRIMLTKEAKREPNDPGLDRILRAAVRHDFPVNMLCWGNVDAGTALIDRHPDTRFIIDHLAILQPRTPPAPPQPWADLPKVLDLAKRKNAVIKVSGACTLSRNPIPSRTSGTRSPACSMPGVSTAACGARTGRAHSPSSTTSRPSSLSSRLTD
jgi:predicted TIM-barrel fold metal-dependent hydrolase